MIFRFFSFVFLPCVFFTTPQANAFELFNPLTAVTSAVEHVVEDRSSKDAAKDLKIKASITTEVIGKMGADVASISSDVYEQRVMLTGIVETPEQKAQAEKLTKGIEGVKIVFNELRVVSKKAREKGAVEGFVDDTVIETKMNGLLLKASGVNSRNYRWRSVHGHAYLLGRALSSAELATAKKTIKSIKGVQSVIAHVQVRAKK